LILVGDCRDMLATLPERSVQTVVTSPPYFGLRDYGHAGQIGLEPTPDEFVAALVEVFRAVRRVLRDDGTVWLNLGDSYNNRAVNRPSSHQEGLGFTSEHLGTAWRDHAANGRARMSILNGDLKEKDLLGIPWMVAFALRADGWYLRSDIIWSKPNPMPESVTDRPTKAHEYLFLLSKGPRYFYDADAIREGSDHPHLAGRLQKVSYHDDSAMRQDGDRIVERTADRNRRSVWTVATAPFAGAHFATFPPKLIEPCILAGSAPGDVVLDPFAGAGTVGVVCGWHGREFIGCELNPTYAQMARDRIALEGRPGGPPNGHTPTTVVDGQASIFDVLGDVA
jgi:DNA modification methylase